MGFNVGSSGGYQNQNGQTSGSYTGDSTSSTDQNSTGTTTGSTTGSTTQSSAPVISTAWQDIFNQIRGATGPQGMTAGQTTAANYIEDQMKNGGVTHLQSMAQAYPEIYGQQPEVVSKAIADAGPAANYMDPYRKGYTDDVLSATMADLDQAHKETQNDLRGQYGGAGWSASAGSPASLQVAAAEGADKYLRTRATTGANIRDMGFTRALQGGAGDRDSAQQRNIAQAGLDMTASGQNASILNNRQQFDATQATNNDLRRDNLASRLFDTGSSGFDQLLRSLSGAQTTIGQTNTGTTSGSSTGTTIGSSSGTTTGSQSGTTQGTNATQGTGRQSQNSFGK